MTVDPKVYDLAAQFLSDEPLLNTDAAKTTLAIAIQQAIESEIDFMRRQVEPMSAEKFNDLNKRST